MPEELLVRHGSPTLAGLKTGNLFACAFADRRELGGELRRINRRLSAKGVRLLPLRCREGRAALALVCTSAAEQLERKRQQAAWRRFQAAVVRIARRNAAGAGEIDAIAAGGPAVLVLRSGVAKKEKHNWQADLTFPDADQPNEPLTLKVHGRAGNSVDAGTFVIFGLEIPIKGGVGHLSRTQLLENHHRGGVAFRWPDGSTIAGTPVLNA